MNAIKAKAILKVAGIITLAVVFGFSVFSCSTDDDSSSSKSSSLGLPGNARNTYGFTDDFAEDREDAKELWEAAMDFIADQTDGIAAVDEELYIEKFNVGKAATKVYSAYPTAQTTLNLNEEVKFINEKAFNDKLIINGSSKIVFNTPANLYNSSGSPLLTDIPNTGKMDTTSTVSRTYAMTGVEFDYNSATYEIYGTIVISSTKTLTGEVVARSDGADPVGRWKSTAKGSESVAMFITVVKPGEFGARFRYRAANNGSGNSRQAYSKGEDIYSYIEVLRATGNNPVHTFDGDDDLFPDVSNIAKQFEHIDTFLGQLRYNY